MTQSRSIPPATAADAASPDAAQAPTADGAFLRKPFVQNVLPFLTSLSVHGGIVAAGLLAFTAISIIHKSPLKDQVVAADFTLDRTPMVPQFIGDANLPNLQNLQNKQQNEKDGTSQFVGSSMKNGSTGGGLGSDPANILDLGSKSSFAEGMGIGIGRGPGNGDGADGGPLARFGDPQRGGGKMFVLGRGARRIAFVCDASGSMITKMESLKAELAKAVNHLSPIQSFSIIFFQDKRPEMLDQSLQLATPEIRRKAGAFLEGVTATGTTDPIPGIEAAFRQQPELIYLLTDGDFPDNAVVLAKVRELNKGKKVRINTIAFVGAADNEVAFIETLKTIASENGGTYRHVSEDELGG